MSYSQSFETFGTNGSRTTLYGFMVGSFRPPGALYCRECGVLIQEYDHLCPWTGTGIGRGNMCAFKTFVVSINVLCYCSIGLVVWGLLDGLAAGERLYRCGCLPPLDGEEVQPAVGEYST
eukprot:scaffold46737_cov168-Amphora_coffeaeformis.AAC.1